MVTNYPVDLDDLTNYPDIIDGITNFKASTFNNLKEALFAIEAELGIKPSGVYSTVRQRLDMLEDMLNTLMSLLTNNPVHTFVFRPGGVPLGNVYDNWSLLYADLILFAGPRIIEIDDSIAAITIPAGTYNLDGNVELRKKNNTNSLPITVSMASGAAFIDAYLFVGINLQSNSATSVLNYSTITKSLYLKDGSRLSPLSTGHMINISDDMSIYLDSGSIFSTPGSTGNVLNMSGSGGATVDIFLSENTTLNANTLSGAITESLNVTISDSSAFIGSTQTAFLGALSFIKKQNSEYVSYDDGAALPALSVDNVQDALDGLKGLIGGGSGITSVFVFRPGGVAVDNAYTTWTSLYAAFSVVPGPKIIEIDDSNAPASIPAGSYDLNYNAIIRGFAGGATYPTLLSLDNGAELENPYKFEYIDITSNSNSQAFSFTLSPNSIYLNNAFLTTAGTSVIFDIGGNLSLYIDNGSDLITGTEEIFNILATGQLDIFIDGFSDISSDTLSGVVGGALNIYFKDNSSTYSSTQTNLLFSPSLFRQAEAQYTSYNDVLVTPSLSATNVQDAIDALKTGAGVSTTFVYNPSGIANNNVYTSWVNLYADLQLVDGPRVIEFVENATIPAGTYNFENNVALRGSATSAVYPVEVSIADLTTLSNLSRIENIALISLSTADIFNFTNTENRLYLDNSTLAANNSGYIYSVPSGDTFSIYLEGYSALITDTSDIIDVPTTTSLNIHLEEGSAIEADTLSAAVGAVVDIKLLDASSTYNTTQTNMLATPTITYLSDASRILYTDAVPLLNADDVQGAIDALKDHLVPDQKLYYAASGVFSTNSTSFEATGGVLFNPAAISAVSWLTRTIYFVIIAEITSGFTGEVQLYNITDATTVTNSLLTVTATSPTKHITAALAVPADLPNSEKLYELQYRISVGVPGPTDKLIIKSAYLLVEYT